LTIALMLLNVFNPAINPVTVFVMDIV